MPLSIKRLILILCAIVSPLTARALTAGAWPAPTIVISPANAAVGVSATMQYAATVNGVANAPVTWMVNGTRGGNATLGTISNSGVYTAPAHIPSSKTLIVAVTSSEWGMAYVNVVASGLAITAVKPNPIPVGEYSITVNGSGFQPGATVFSGGVQMPTTWVNSTTLLATGYQGTSGAGSVLAKNPGGNPGTPFPVTFGASTPAISPAAATVPLGGTKQFTAQGATSWTTNAGSVTASGLYTAPTKMPPSPSVSVTATGASGASSAVVTLTSPTSCSASPASVTLSLNQTQQFVCPQVTVWQASAGTINSSGLYTAPATLPSSSTVTITGIGAFGTTNAYVTLSGSTAAQTISPAAVAIQLGASQQFTSPGATSWTATAGTVSSTGLFTAPVSPSGIILSPGGPVTSGVANAPSWTQVTNLPNGFTGPGAGVIYTIGDGKLYAVGRSGTSPNIVISIWVATESSMPGGAWTNITSPSLSNDGTAAECIMGMMPNGTVLMSVSKSGRSDVFYWNGSTSSPSWTKVGGWDGVSSSSIYAFTNDSAGYTYFSPAWSGDIWRNTAPNSTTFTRVFTNLYGLVGSTGGLYELHIWNLGDGRGDTLWACGEGGLLNVDLKFTSAKQYLTGGAYKGNCYGLAKSATNILALRTADGNGDAVNDIAIANRSTTILPTSGGYPAFTDTNFTQGFNWINGTNWMFNTVDSSGTNVSLLLSQNDGSTWSDITASGLPSSCTGTNLSVRALSTANYIYARCQNGTSYWQYGPISPTSSTTTTAPNTYYVTAYGPNGSATATIALVSGVTAQTISPSAVSVTLGQALQFTSAGATSWTTNAGSVSSTGLYTAPATMPSSSTAYVTATGPNGSATATISLASGVTAQTISPSAASVTLGQALQFTSVGATSWTTNAGSVSSTGLYTAPATMPSSSTASVTATGPGGSATATISLASGVTAQTISPSAVSVTLGQALQFTSVGALSWTTTAGSVSSTGLYIAPSTMPSSSAASITATGPGGTATATVSLVAGTTTGTGNVSIATQNPLYGWQVIPGATRRIHATVTNGASNQVNWSYTTTGGASATIAPAVLPNIPGAFVDVTVGSTGSACTNVGSSTSPVFTSAATVVLKATSVDDTSKSTTVAINVCNPTVQVFISPFNVRLYSGQTVNLQSWVWGAVDDNVTWSVSQPAGGNGQFIAPPAGGSATTARDAVFSATVAGNYTVTATSVANPSVSATAILSVSSTAMPSYAVTPNHTEPVDCSVDPTVTGKTYDVGAGHPYAMLSDAYVAIGSNTLSPGTTIRLFNTDTTGTNPTRFHEYLRLDGQGTQAQPIRIVGCADSAGNLPIMDAQNATSYSPTDNSVAAQIAGLYQIGIHHSNGFAVYPTINSPSYIIIEGIAFRNAYPTTSNGGGTSNYYNPGSSSATAWGTTASCIRPYEGNHLTVRGNDMQDCSFGILADFNGNNGWGGFFGDFDLQGNYFTNIGANNQSEHMAYVQGFRQVIQGNVFDTLKSVSQSGELKMRGVAEVVRYNFFNTTSNTRTIDFVEEQDSSMYMSFVGYFYTPAGSMSFHNEYPNDGYTPDMIAAGDEAWHKAYAYGNIVNFGPTTPSSQAPIHFFGDQGAYSDPNTNPPVRVGDLFDYSNTFYSVGGGTSSPPNFNLVDTMQNQDNQIRSEWPFLTIWNNAIYSGPLNTTANQGFQMSTVRSDVYNFGPNWLSSNWGTNNQTCTNSACWAGTGWPWYQETTEYMDGGNLPAHITGASNLITGGSTIPFSTSNFIPTSGGGLVGAGAALPASISNMPVRFQMTAPSYVLTPRKSPLTLGAHD